MSQSRLSMFQCRRQVVIVQDLQGVWSTYLFISHGLAVVKHISTRVAVMYLGRIVEIASAKDLYLEPLHPYTQAYFGDTDSRSYAHARTIVLQGDVPHLSIRRQVAVSARAVHCDRGMRAYRSGVA